MKFKKLIAALSTVTMLGTLAMSVPVSAKAVSGDTGAVAATVSAQVRANDSAFTDRNRVEIKTGASGGIEMTQKSGVYFGAYYSFKKLDIPEGAKIDSATLTITKYDAFTDRKFNVIALNVTDAESTNGETIFNAVSSAYSTATVVTANETERNNTAPIVADVTTIFDKSKDNTFFVTNQMVESSKRQLKPDATLQVKYTYEEPDEPVAQIGTKKHAEYFSFKGENGISYNTLTATAEKDGNKDTKSTPIMTITDVTDIVVSVTDIPEGITITGIVLDSIAPVE